MFRTCFFWWIISFMLRANIGNIEHRSSESIYTSIHLSIDEKAQPKKVPHSKKMATSPPWPHIIWLLLSVCSDSGVLNLQPATSLHVNYDRAMCNVQCEIDCSKTVKIVAWVICSRMAELCTAQSCIMANFILIHQTTVQCVLCSVLF